MGTGCIGKSSVRDHENAYFDTSTPGKVPLGGAIFALVAPVDDETTPMTVLGEYGLIHGGNLPVVCAVTVVSEAACDEYSLENVPETGTSPCSETEKTDNLTTC